MPLLSYVHQLFSAEQCQAYIHTLRWKDRSLQCPRCHSYHVDPWGTYHYRPGCQRYRCHGCKRTDKSLADTCLGMLRYGLVQRVGRGRYVAAELSRNDHE
jgi:transposase-like protein